MPRPLRLSGQQAAHMLGSGTQATDDLDALFGPPVKRRPYRPAEVPTVPADARVLGLDLALGTTGWALVQDGRCHASGSFHLPGSLRKGELAVGLDTRRLYALTMAVSELVAHHRPEYLAFEYPDRLGHGWWDAKRAPLTPYYLGIARGLLVAAVHGLLAPEQVLAVPMTGAKRVIGGSAASSKERIRLALRARGIDVSEMSPDESDAASVALAVLEGSER